MRKTLVIPTNVDWYRLNNTKESLINNTFEPRELNVIFIDNGNTFGHDLEKWVNDLRPKTKANLKHIKLPERMGLTTTWMVGTINSHTEWTIIVNDDIYYMPGWDLKFEKVIKTKQASDCGCVLLCHPYNWSGFAVDKNFILEFPWRTEFPEGYHEDNDLYLRVAKARKLKTKHDIYTKGIYNLPYNTSNKEYCFQHLHHNQTEKSPFYTRWDEQANKEVFDKYWQEVPSDHPLSIENKNGQFYMER